MLNHSLLTIVPAFLLLVLAFFARSLQGNWLAPAPFFSLYWATFTFIVLLFAPEFPVFPTGMWAIVLIVSSFQAGSLIMFSFMAPDNNWTKYDDKRISGNVSTVIIKRMYQLTSLLTIVSAIGVAFLVSVGIKMFGLSFSIDELLSMGHLFSVLRYNEEGLSDPLLVKIFQCWIFPASLLGGLSFSFAKSFREKVMCIMPFFISLLSGMIVAARAGIVYVMILWLSGFLSVKVYMSHGKYKVVQFKSVLLLVTGVALLVLIFVSLQWLRGGAIDTIDSSFLNHMKVGAFGSLAAFTTWFNFQESIGLTLGAYTFPGPFDFLGLAEREGGVYIIPIYFESGGSTNIYTLFRGLIEDFSLPGAIVLSFFAGLITSISYRKCGNGHIRWILPLSIFYALTLLSQFYSIFTHNSVILAWVVAFFVFILPEYKTLYLRSDRKVTNHE